MKVAWRVAAVCSMLVACSFEPRDGQFRCEDGRCPEGLVCEALRCVSPTDGGPETGPADAAGDAPSDALGDAALDAPDAALTCDADFCADFDDVTEVDDEWDVIERVGTGSLRRVTIVDAPSPPAVFESAVTRPPPAAAYHAARLSYQPVGSADYTTLTPRLALSFRFRVTEFSEDNPGVTIGGIVYGADTANVVLALNANAAAGIKVTYFFTPENIVTDLGAIEVDTWYDVRVTIPVRTSTEGVPVGGGVTLQLDDRPATTATLPPAVLTRALRFDVGLASTNPDAENATVEYDAVRIDYR